MGGGDLNLKKSWHPSTLRNIERVWKAEQKHEVEQQKIEQLQKELAEERAREEIQAYAEDQGVVRKREERLDWMYQGPTAMVNREDYLLGRKVDKTLEILEHAENGSEPKNEDLDIGSTMFSSQDLSGTATVDLANKIREDPLFSIMKKEKEQRKNLLSNPVKMKQLQQILQQSLGKGKKKSKKMHSDSDNEESNSKKHHSENKTEGKHHRKHKKSRKHSRHYSSDEDEAPTERSQDRHVKSKRTNSDEDKYQRKNSSSKTHQNSSYKDREYHDQPSRYAERNFRESHGKSQNNKDGTSDSRSKRKLDSEERDRRLQEMQDNAKWREKQRERKVRRYREDEEEEAKATKLDGSDFIKPMLSKAAGKGSLENRVKQKMFSIQRGKADMDKNFLKR